MYHQSGFTHKIEVDTSICTTSCMRSF